LPPTFATGVAADFFPAFLDGAYRAEFSEFSEEILSTLTIAVVAVMGGVNKTVEPGLGRHGHTTLFK